MTRGTSGGRTSQRGSASDRRVRWLSWWGDVARSGESWWYTTARWLVEVRYGKAVDHGERHPGRAREPGRGLPGPHLSQRLLAHGAGARAGRAVLAAPRIPDPLSRGGGEDGDQIPRRGEDLR